MVVPNDLFTSFLKMITTSSSIIIKKKPSGSLTIKTLKPGNRLFLLCTDIGIAAVNSIISEPNTYANRQTNKTGTHPTVTEPSTHDPEV